MNQSLVLSADKIEPGMLILVFNTTDPAFIIHTVYRVEAVQLPLVVVKAAIYSQTSASVLDTRHATVMLLTEDMVAALYERATPDILTKQGEFIKKVKGETHLPQKRQVKWRSES